MTTGTGGRIFLKTVDFNLFCNIYKWLKAKQYELVKSKHSPIPDPMSPVPSYLAQPCCQAHIFPLSHNDCL